MPQFQVTTKGAEKVWEKGDLAIFKLTLDYQGQEMSAKTYSKTIANVGWNGTVMTYEKPGRNGAETFVKQPQQEGGYQGGGGGKSFGGGKSQPQDNYTMYLSYVKDIAVALVNTKAYTADRLNEIATDVATTGEMFYAMRPDAQDKKPDVTPEADKIDQIMGGGTEVVDEEETPWTEPPQLPTS